jgi:hypothetical protein
MRQLLILGRNPGVNQLVKDILSHIGFASRIYSAPGLPPEDIQLYNAVVIDDEEALFVQIIERYPGIPVIFLATAGAYDTKRVTVQKPFSVADLVNAIQRALGPE